MCKQKINERKNKKHWRNQGHAHCSCIKFFLSPQQWTISSHFSSSLYSRLSLCLTPREDAAFQMQMKAGNCVLESTSITERREIAADSHDYYLNPAGGHRRWWTVLRCKQQLIRGKKQPHLRQSLQACESLMSAERSCDTLAFAACHYLPGESRMEYKWSFHSDRDAVNCGFMRACVSMGKWRERCEYKANRVFAEGNLSDLS